MPVRQRRHPQGLQGMFTAFKQEKGADKQHTQCCRVIKNEKDEYFFPLGPLRYVQQDQDIDHRNQKCGIQDVVPKLSDKIPLYRDSEFLHDQTVFNAGATPSPPDHPCPR